MQWRICGVNRKSGAEIPPFTIEAESEKEALDIAAKRGVMVTSIHSDGPTAPPVAINTNLPLPEWKCPNCFALNTSTAMSCSQCAVSRTEDPQTGLSAVACVLLPLFGIAALAYSLIAEVCILQQNYSKAHQYAKIAGSWRLAAFVSFGVCVILLLVMLLTVLHKT